MNDILRIGRLRIALQRAFLGRAILRVIVMKQTRVTGASNEGGREEEGGGGEGENVTMAGQTNNQATRKDRATQPMNAGGLR